MAVASTFVGDLVGYSTYTKDGKTYHQYAVLVRQRVDKAIGLPQDCDLFTIREETQVLGDKLKSGVKVQFQCAVREFQGKNGLQVYRTFSDIEAI